MSSILFYISFFSYQVFLYQTYADKKFRKFSCKYSIFAEGTYCWYEGYLEPKQPGHWWPLTK